MSNSVYTVENLSFAYEKDKPIFTDMSLTLTEGVVTTLIGANGSGKSTLFNLMTKNLKPDKGKIMLRGGDVTSIRLRDFAKLVAIVHQTNTAPAGLSVRRLVEYGRYPHRSITRSAETDEDETMVNWALETTGLTEFANKPATSLSGGQRQRAWIAMALAQGTDVLLLDEPTTYLDVRYQLDILRLVRQLNQEYGLTVVMVLHDINQSLNYSDEVVALADGKVLAKGEPADVITPELVSEVYKVDLEVTTVHGKPFVLAV